ncbi:16635_t:CDS:2, partial [Cetraspora pellucida]
LVENVNCSQRRREHEQKNKQIQKKYILELAETRLNNIDAGSLLASNIEALTKVLYRLQCQESANLELDPTRFENMIEQYDPQLQ